MASGTPPTWGRAWWRTTFTTLTATSSLRIGMALPGAAKSRVWRKPRIRSECTTPRAATIRECAVTALDRRGSNPLTPRNLSRLLSSILGRYPCPPPRNALWAPYLREPRGIRNGTVLLYRS